MKDITRIHIAKVSYDIELPAKKKLETYISQLEAYAQDADVLEDIEIRITELLQERNVKQNNVITVDDVTGVCEQLGDPKEFMADGDVVADDVSTTETRKRLYRNTDTALVGGVLSGIASYFNINPLWTRLVFVVLTLISAGFGLFVYVLFWFIVPPAKTAAEKLSMSGRPVTLIAIREINHEIVANQTPRIVLRVVTILIGLGAVLSVIGIIAGAIYSFIVLPQVAGDRNVGEVISQSIGSSYPLSIALGGIAAITLVVFLILVAYAAFKQTFGKRIWITAIILVAVGLTSFGSAVGSIAYGTYDLSVQAAKSLVTTQSGVPKGFESITSFSVKDVDHAGRIDYIVDSTPRMEVISATNDKVSITVDGNKATLHYAQGNKTGNGYRYDMTTLIRVYGPALSSIDVDASSLAYQGGAQSSLSLNLKHGGQVITSNQSRIETLDVTATDTAGFDGQASTIGKVTADISLTSDLRVGTVASLIIKAPTTCAVNARSEVHTVKVNDGFVTYNDAKLFNTQYQDSCMTILSGGEPSLFDQGN